MVCGRCEVWCELCGVWCVVCGVWCAVCGMVVYGMWCAICGVWLTVGLVCGISLRVFPQSQAAFLLSFVYYLASLAGGRFVVRPLTF